MTTVAVQPPARKPQYRATHYAYLGDVYGTAEFVSGSGYLFRAEGARQAVLVSYKDANLLLLGLCDLSEMQADLDALVGGPAQIACTRQMLEV